MENINTKFNVTIYGNLEPYNEVISKARCRIFYKYANRNGTYISDEFADQLLSTISYTPVKGIYDIVDGDYTSHGKSNDEGRIYGIVPENPNITWEPHLDEDGVERTYACTDVLIFTGLYAEASQIVGKSQSMELYPNSLKGEWTVINGVRYFKFTSGCFFGLQVLGEDVTPCFQGAAFFELRDSLKEFVKKIEAIQSNYSVDQKGGKDIMNINFKLSDEEKKDALFMLLNPNFKEDEWIVDFDIVKNYSDYCVAFNYSERQYYKVNFVKGEDDSVTLGDMEKIYPVFVSAEDKERCTTYEENNSEANIINDAFNAFEKVNELNSQIENLTSEKNEFELKINELNESLTTLNTEKASFESKIEEMTNTQASLNSELDSLKEFKYNAEKNEKVNLINTYSDKLSEDLINEFTAKVDEYTAENLKKELAYTLVETNPTIFSKQPDMPLVPKDSPKSGIEGILSKYKHN